MIEKIYITRLKKMIRSHFPSDKYSAFIFGSSLRQNQFHDIDVAIQGKVNRDQLWQLKEVFEESTFPYFIDLVAFDQTEKDFQDYVLTKEKKRWI